MPPNSGQFWLPPHERFASQLRHLANQDLFSQNKRFAKEYSQKALQIFREGQFEPNIAVGTSSAEGLDFVMSFDDGEKVSVSILGGPGRVFQFDTHVCTCEIFKQHNECPHIAAAYLMIWGIAQNRVHRERKYGFTDANRDKVFRLKKEIHDQIITKSPPDVKAPPVVTKEVQATVGKLKSILVRVKDRLVSHVPDAAQYRSTGPRSPMTVDPLLVWPFDVLFEFEGTSPALALQDVLPLFETRQLPQRLFPRLERASFFSKYATQDELLAPRRREHEMTLLQVVDHAFREQQKSDHVMRFEYLNDAKDYEAHPIDRLIFLSDTEEKRRAQEFPDFQLVMRGDKLSLKLGDNDGRFILTSNFAYDRDTKTLFVHQFDQLLQTVWSNIEAPGQSFQERYDRIRSTLGLTLPQITLPADTVVADINPEDIWIDLQNNGFRIQSAPEAALKLQDLPTPWPTLFKGFQIGFGVVPSFHTLLDVDTTSSFLKPFERRLLTSSLAFASFLKPIYLALAESRQLTSAEILTEGLASVENILNKADRGSVYFGELDKRLHPRILTALGEFASWIRATIFEPQLLDQQGQIITNSSLNRIPVEFAIEFLGDLFGRDDLPSSNLLESWAIATDPDGGTRYGFNSTLGFPEWTLIRWVQLAKRIGTGLKFQDRWVEVLDASAFKSEFVIFEPTAEQRTLAQAESANTASPSGIDSDTGESTGESNSSNSGSTARSLDWFELQPSFFIGKQQLDLERARILATTGQIEADGKLYVLNDLNSPTVQALRLFWTGLTQANQTARRSTKNPKESIGLSRHQVLDLLALRAQGLKVKGGKRWQQICDFYDGLSRPRELVDVSPDFNGELKAYQKIGANWLLDLYQIGLGGILADDMGLGKTIQTLAFLDILRMQDRVQNALIVVPATLVFNWVNEAEKFIPNLRVVVLSAQNVKEELTRTGKIEPRICLCTYNFLTDNRNIMSNLIWDMVVFDEAQALKNMTSQRSQAARQIPAQFKISLTGTPLENHVGETFAILDLVVPGCLGTFNEFRRRYMNSEINLREAAVPLKQKIRPLILRRTKSEILKELPAKTESVMTVPFEERQRQLYRDIAMSWNKRVNDSVSSVGEARSQLLMITALLRLRQVCSDPAALPDVSYPQIPPKIVMLMESIAEILEAGESVVVFTQFLSTYQRIMNSLVEQKIPHQGLHGGLNRAQREKAIMTFQEDERPNVFVATLKTGGVGLNLTKASYVIHIEPWWNPAVENQATDRTHRIGQTRPVQVYRYIMKDSIEEKIQQLKVRKMAEFDAIFSLEASDLSSFEGRDVLTQDDFRFLLGDLEPQ